MAPNQYEQRVKLEAKRGIIYDRNMNLLAMDLPVLSLAIDPTQVEDNAKTASVIADILGGKEGEYFNLLIKNKNKNFVWVKKEISDDQKNLILGAKVQGLIHVKGRKRVHPYDDLGLQVLGITNVEHQGIGGIEQAFDEILKGRDGWAVFQKDGLNRNFSSLDYPVENPENGNHIVSTIDHLCQTIVEEELRRGVINHVAKGGSAVLMDPFTGEILAMASIIGERVSSDNPGLVELLQNKSLQIAFEPGSTFKIVTAAAAMEEGVFKPGSLIHCENGIYRLANHPIHDHNKKYAWLTLNQVMEVSSNIGAAKIGRKLGKKTLYEYIQNFGFGNRTGIGLPGETSGILRPIYRWSELSTAMISFGQEMSVTSLQLACMISTITNGGVLMKPQIVRSVLDDTGRELQPFFKKVIRRVIAEETAEQLMAILENVVENGNGSKATVEGVRVAGKTGTAQKSIPGYKGYFPGAYVSSFVGFWPAEAPRFTLVIVLDEPKEEYWGATSAAPIFSRIVTRTVGLPISPWLRKEQEKQNPPKKQKFVFSSMKKYNEDASTGMKEIPEVDSPYHIPKLLGLSVREALQKLAVLGIEANVKGSGVVVSQDPAPTVKIKNGMTCYLICRTTIESELQQ